MKRIEAAILTRVSIEDAEATTGSEKSKLPSEIMYIPEGESTITPYVDGKPQEITVRLNPADGVKIAAQFQNDLTERQKQNVRPWTDFNHNNKGPASAIPRGFRYGELTTPDGPKRGLILALDWTLSGKKAIIGKDYSYFSPACNLTDDNVPCGLDARGPVGGLVNEPAFREIPRIAASDAAPTEKTDIKPMKTILAALGIAETDTNAEASAVTKIQAQAARITALEAAESDLKKKVEAHEATIKKNGEDRAKVLVEAAVASGKILPADEDTKGFYTRLITAGDAGAEKVLMALPVLNKDLGKRQVEAEDGKDKEKGEKTINAHDALVAALAEDMKKANP